MWSHARQARLDEVTGEIHRRRPNINTMSAAEVKQFDKLLNEGESLVVERQTYEKAMNMDGFASPRPDGRAPESAPAQMPQWQLPEGQGSNIAQRKHHAPSPYDMAPEQLESLFLAGKSNQTFSTTVDDKGQLFTDFEDVASFIPRELSNWITIGENYQLLQGNGTAPNQLGLFNQTGTLTRQYNSTGGDTVIDTILEAVTDVREGGAYAQADLILLHPADWLAMRKLKTTFNSYVLDPNDPSTLGGIDNLFGYRVAVSTQVPQGNAAVMDSKLAVNIFRRWGLEIMANPYADTAFEYNQIHYRAETRFALGVIYPAAICLVDLTDSA